MEVPFPGDGGGGGGNIPVDPGPPGVPPPQALPVPGPVEGELLFLPDPENGVLNHGGGVDGPVAPQPANGPMAPGLPVQNQRSDRLVLKVLFCWLSLL